MATPWTDSMIEHLTTEALVAFLGRAERFEAALHPGCALILTNEPSADLNMIVAGARATESKALRGAVELCLGRELPFLAMLFPSAGAEASAIVAELGLVHAGEWPLMVRDEGPIEIPEDDSVSLERTSDAGAVGECVGVLSAAFGMPRESMRRAAPPELYESPALDLYVARREGRVVSCVVLTHHGDTGGVWAMATAPEAQRSGIGRRLLAAAMSMAGEFGARRFFLGATPAGRPLYERLGFKPHMEAQVWVSGESGQT